MDDREMAEIQHNKAVRGYIIRSLVKGYNNTALTRQLSNSMIAAGLIISPDITKSLDYLKDAAGRCFFGSCKPEQTDTQATPHENKFYE